ncbi:hypothetical protein [Sulfitobacter dubius]|uniref:hypothetical protein n=1 Tax=Sulfitobacter dubius TaxID=218673 RepID=UPI002942FC8E|nr:hypothetical protein [Sulfitobacter dubius]WOI30223.1 hypothetical protein R1T39_05820 [Sulfitobacter dubius]
MFRNEDTSVLRREIDRFKLPMFIAELNNDNGHFELLALNTAHEANSGMVMAEVIKRPLHAIMPEDEAEAVNERYARCVSNAGQIRYREMLHMPRGPLIWDTTLHYVQSDRGIDRVVGSAIVVERVQRDNRDTLAFEDVRYFAATSSFKLEQISTVLDAAEKGLIDPAKLTGSAGMLAGLCRAIDSTMQELRPIAQERLEADANPTVHLIDVDSADIQEGDEIEAAIAALVDMADNLPTPPANKTSAASPLARSVF